MNIDHLCACKARHGEYFFVHRYKYSHSRVREITSRMRREGRLRLHHQDSEGLYYYRPQDVPALVRAERAHMLKMIEIYERNTVWYAEQAARHGANAYNDQRTAHAQDEIVRLRHRLTDQNAIPEYCEG